MDFISSATPIFSGHTTSTFADSGAGDRTREDIAVAGEEFESVFLSMLLKNMRSTVSEDGMFAGDNSDTFGGMFDLFMSQHLAKSDALGVGSMIEGFLENTK